jgi:hypothetical protein
MGRSQRPGGGEQRRGQALERALIARSEREQRWQLNQLRGLLLTARFGNLSLDEGLGRLIRILQTPMADR